MRNGYRSREEHNFGVVALECFTGKGKPGWAHNRLHTCSRASRLDSAVLAIARASRAKILGPAMRSINFSIGMSACPFLARRWALGTPSPGCEGAQALLLPDLKICRTSQHDISGYH